MAWLKSCCDYLPIIRLCCSVWCSVLTNAPCNAVLSVAGCSVFELNHRRVAVQFAVHFLPMPCYRWLAVGGGVHFCRVRTAPKSPLYAHHLRCVLACGVGGMFAYPMA